MISGRFPFDCAHISDPYYRMLIEEKYDDFWKAMNQYASFSNEAMDLI
jgi:hypothetical protein